MQVGGVCSVEVVSSASIPSARFQQTVHDCWFDSLLLADAAAAASTAPVGNTAANAAAEGLPAPPSFILSPHMQWRGPTTLLLFHLREQVMSD